MNLQNKQVVVSGATGYLGQHVVAELIKQGALVRAIARIDSPPADLASLQNLGATIYTGKLEASASDLDRAFSGADYGVHLIGSVAPPRGGPNIKQLHQDYTKYFAAACVRSGLQKALLVTALGARVDSSSQYLAAKQLAESAFIKCLSEAGIACTVVRPSLIVGRLVGGRDSKLVERYRILLKTRPAVPLVGGGVNLLQPIFVGDLARAIASWLCGACPQDRQIYEVGGPEKLTMRQFVEALALSLGVSKPFVNLSDNVAGVAAAFLSLVQKVPLLSPDQVKLAREDMVAEVNALPEMLAGSAPVPLKEALASYQA